MWPGVLVAVLMFAASFTIPILVPEARMGGVISALVGALAIVVWWLFFSRAPWFERLGTIVLMAVALFATSQLVHVSIRTGMMGLMLGIYAIPVLCLVLVAWAVASRRQPPALRLRLTGH